MYGVFQAGSVAKVVTSLAAARAGLLGLGHPAAWPRRARSSGCLLRDAQGPYFTRPGWYKAIHDHPEDPIHGNIDYIKAIAVSCNVYFGQLGLALGPDAFINLVKDGVEVGWNGKVISPGKAGSRELAETAFGQAAALMSVSQLARVGGTVAGGGIYRKCGAGMDLSAPCEERKILAEPNLAVPILSGMEQVVLAGTARGLLKPAGHSPLRQDRNRGCHRHQGRDRVRRAVQRVGPAELVVPRHRGGRTRGAGPGAHPASHRHRRRGAAGRARRAGVRSGRHGDPRRGPVARLHHPQGGAARTAGRTRAGGDGLALAGRRRQGARSPSSPR